MNESRGSASPNADLDYAPPPFDNASGHRVVFVDFLRAEYDITFDVAQESALARSEIVFFNAEAGYPAFDLLVDPNTVEIDGQATNAVRESSPDNATRFRRLTTTVSPGEHVLKISHQIPGGAQTTGEGVRWYRVPPRVSCMFSMTDLNRIGRIPENGGYLERYLPSNFEFDHFSMQFRVKVVNSTRSHRLFTNIPVSGDNEWQFELPDYYATSCPWFHLVPERDIGVETASFTSIDGREIPLVVYTIRRTGWQSMLNHFLQETRRALSELEGRHGAFPHQQVTVFAVRGTSGMEYSGATWTGIGPLEHELNHSYFARNIVPADGDSGWIDEAIASWGDRGNFSSVDPPTRTDNMGNRSPYRRRTHYSAYTQGRDFLAYLDFRCRSVGGMTAVLNEYIALKGRKSITSAKFQKLVEDKAGESFETEFDTFVYGRGAAPAKAEVDFEEDADHPHGVPNADMANEFFPDEED